MLKDTYRNQNPYSCLLEKLKLDWIRVTVMVIQELNLSYAANRFNGVLIFPQNESINLLVERCTLYCIKLLCPVFNDTEIQNSILAPFSRHLEKNSNIQHEDLQEKKVLAEKAIDWESV